MRGMERPVAVQMPGAVLLVPRVLPILWVLRVQAGLCWGCLLAWAMYWLRLDAVHWPVRLHASGLHLAVWGLPMRRGLPHHHPHCQRLLCPIRQRPRLTGVLAWGELAGAMAYQPDGMDGAGAVNGLHGLARLVHPHAHAHAHAHAWKAQVHGLLQPLPQLPLLHGRLYLHLPLLLWRLCDVRPLRDGGLHCPHCSHYPHCSCHSNYLHDLHRLP